MPAMTRGKLVWDPRPPNLRERVIAGFWLAAFIPVSVNYLADYRLFGGHDKQVLAGLMVATALLFRFLPGVRREYE